jgi:hypothetical protein
MNIIVKILPNVRNTPVGKLADAELHFTGGELDGLKLIGFAVWVRRDGNGEHVTFPARPFTVHGERRSFSLIRAIDNSSAQDRPQDRLRNLVLQAYVAETAEVPEQTHA